jgi:hypothetical protein
MVEFLVMGLQAPYALSIAPLDDSVAPAVRVALLFGLFAVSGGFWIAKRLTRSWRSAPSEDPRAACRLHDWLQMDDGRFVCLRCNYRAGSSFPLTRDRSG